MRNRRIHILIGLPGSGKSRFASEFSESITNTTPCLVFDTDKIIEETKTRLLFSKNTTPYQIFIDSLCYHYSFNCKDIIKNDYMIDGLFITEKSILKIIESALEVIIYHEVTNSKNTFPPITIVLHYWDEDRENCLINDNNRLLTKERKESSKSTITNHPFIDLTTKDNIINLINSIKAIDTKRISSVKLERHEVYKMSNYEKEINSLIGCVKNPYIVKNEHGDTILRSDSWCTGGAAGNCWDNTMYTIDGEKPLEFEEFDDIMASLTPDIKFIDYKRMKNKVVKCEEYSYGDYYGGNTSYSRWTCNLTNLNMLIREYGYSVKE